MNTTRDRKMLQNGCMDLTLSQITLNQFQTPPHVFIMEQYLPAHSRTKGKCHVSALLLELPGLLFQRRELTDNVQIFLQIKQ